MYALQVNCSSELITQLRHELHTKTDLLRVYSADEQEYYEDDEARAAGDAVAAGGKSAGSPSRLRAVNVELLQRKIRDLEGENRRLQEEATEVCARTTRGRERGESSG